MYKVNGYYYLLTAEGGTKFEHASTIARGTHIEGPYEVHPQNPLISSWRQPEIATKSWSWFICENAD